MLRPVHTSHPQDLRERVASNCAYPGRAIAQVAVAFSASTAFVNKLLHRQRTTGPVRPHPVARPWA